MCSRPRGFVSVMPTMQVGTRPPATLCAPRVTPGPLLRDAVGGPRTPPPPRPGRPPAISHGVPKGSKGKWTVHLMNRTPEPIAGAVEVFATYDVNEKDGALFWSVLVPSVPPCNGHVAGG